MPESLDLEEEEKTSCALKGGFRWIRRRGRGTSGMRAFPDREMEME